MKKEDETQNLKWRLPVLPTVEQVSKLIESGVISKEEARSIFFKASDEVKGDELEDIKNELSVIRKLITGLSITNYPAITINEIRRYVEPIRSPWTQPYAYLCSSTNLSGYNSVIS